MKIGYIINTHAGYVKPLNHLLNTMAQCAFLPGKLDVKDVLIVLGGNLVHGIPRLQVYGGCHLLEVEHDSWDYTGLIELALAAGAERHYVPHPFFDSHTHFFCLQDTMEFGVQTSALVASADPEKWATAAFGGQCNLCLYRKDYLLTMKGLILAARNCTKLESIKNEGILWKILQQNLSHRHEASYANGTHATDGTYHRPYGENGAPRIREYYAGVDIVKWKANHGQNMDNMITHP